MLQSRRFRTTMRLLSAYLVVIVFASAKSGLTFVNGLRGNINAGTEDVPRDYAGKIGEPCDVNSLNNMICENDELIFCGPNNQIMSTPCFVKGKQGFCNCEKTACIAQRPVCPDATSDCLQEGVKLPNNLDCHSYTYCTQDRKKLTLKCPGNLIFDLKAEKCMDQNTAQCKKIVCPTPGNKLQLIPFPQSPNYYVLCYQGIGDVRKCPDKYYAVRNDMCQFDCKLRKESGLFKDTNLERCKKGIYYACKRMGTNFSTVQAICPPNYTFNEELGLCTQGDNCTEPENAPS